MKNSEKNEKKKTMNRVPLNAIKAFPNFLEHRLRKSRHLFINFLGSSGRHVNSDRKRENSVIR